MGTIRLFGLYSLKEQIIQINHKIIENIRDQNKQKVYLWVYVVLFKGRLYLFVEEVTPCLGKLSYWVENTGDLQKEEIPSH